MNDRISNAPDKAGIASAILCTVHCIAIPVLFLLKFSISAHDGYCLPSWWKHLDYVFLIVSFFAVYHSVTHTKTQAIKVSLWLFWAILAVAIIFEENLHPLAYIASAGLVSTHFINIRRMKKSTS